jgi:hypothetical protein
MCAAPLREGTDTVDTVILGFTSAATSGFAMDQHDINTQIEKNERLRSGLRVLQRVLDMF